MQHIGRFIEANTIKGTHIRLRNNEMLRGTTALGNDLDILKVTTGDIVEMQQLITVNGALPIPSSPKQYATVEYIQNYIEGKRDAKDAVNVLADSNISLTGATPLTIDSVTVLNGWRVALVGQTTASQNGIYDIAIAGGNYTLTRSSDFDQVNDAGGLEVTEGAYFKVLSGTVYAGWETLLTTANPIVVGTTSLTFALNPTVLALTAGDSLKRIGQDFSIDLATISGLESTNPGQQNGQLRVKVDTATLEKDQSIRIDTTTNALITKLDRYETFTLTAQNITDGFLDIPHVAADKSVKFWVRGGNFMEPVTDFTVNYTGGTNSKTRVTFAGGLASGGVSELLAGDVVIIYYRSF